jgi:hypothetical protein
MRALKILVVVMGVMLVVGFVALVVAIADRLAHRHGAPAETTATLMPLHDQHHAITVPVGVKILGVQGDGGRVILRLGFADGGEELWLIDWRTGARLATIALRVQSAPH